MNLDVAVVGYGARLYAEFGARLVRPSDDDTLVGSWITPDDLYNCLVSVRDERATIHGDADGRLVGFALEPDPASSQRSWTIEVATYTCAWPRGVGLGVSRRGFKGRAFELFHGSEDGLIFLQGPFRGASEAPRIEDLIAPYQEPVDSDMSPDAMWRELRYEHGGRTWRQRHQYAVPAPETIVLVTAQAPEGTEQPIFAACHEIARSVRLRSSSAPRRGFMSGLFGR
jgi:hypothetical protein